MDYKVGDFIVTDKSEYPAIIIEKEGHRNLLVSIVEYNGDYIWLETEEVEKAELNEEEKLSILGKFGDWFYNVHTLIYQELIIDALNNILC